MMRTMRTHAKFGPRVWIAVKQKVLCTATLSLARLLWRCGRCRGRGRGRRRGSAAGAVLPACEDQLLARMRSLLKQLSRVRFGSLFEARCRLFGVDLAKSISKCRGHGSAGVRDHIAQVNGARLSAVVADAEFAHVVARDLTGRLTSTCWPNRRSDEEREDSKPPAGFQT